MAELRKYGVETRIYFPLIDFGSTSYVSGVTIAAGDATISKDGGAFANIVGESADDLFVDEGSGLYSIKVAVAELQAATVVLRIVDQTGLKEWEDQMILIDTYGNASAQHALDLDTALASAVWGHVPNMSDVAPDSMEAKIIDNNDVLNDQAGPSSTMIDTFVDETGFGSSTTQFESSEITNSLEDHYEGRIIIFRTGALAKSASDITAYSLEGGRGRFTVTGFPQAPENGDEFSIV